MVPEVYIFCEYPESGRAYRVSGGHRQVISIHPVYKAIYGRQTKALMFSSSVVIIALSIILDVALKAPCAAENVSRWPTSLNSMFRIWW